MSSIPHNASTGRPMPDQVDSPLALRHIPLTFDNADPEASALKLIEEFAPQWKTEEGEVKFTRFTDGITNTLMKATKKRPGRTELEVESDSVLMRAYGKGTAVLIDRQRELKAHNLLANLGLAPPLLARFDNGLMYRFVPGHVCSHTDLAKPEIYRQVAKRLGQWHGALPISAIAATPILDAQTDQKHLAPHNGQSTRPYPNTWTVLQQWIDALTENNDKEVERKKMLNAELADVSAKLGDTPGFDGRDYVFVHHDLLCGNVIVTETEETQTGKVKEKPVTFIDYEYATPGPAAFDIANHFAEWAGYDCEHSAVPTKSQRREFLKHYVASYRYHSISDTDTIAVEIDFQKDIDTLYEQVEQFRGMPGFFWGVWALIQAMISQIDFDYTKYADLRLSEYFAWKEETDGSRAREGREMHVREKKWHSE